MALIANVDQPLARQQSTDRPQNGQSANARIKNTDGGRGHKRSFTIHNPK
jgi:hypothetical protein